MLVVGEHHSDAALVSRATPLPNLAVEVETLANKVAGHLSKMEG